MKHIVFAGGTHGGKTTLIEYFSNKGHTIVPEAGIQIIAELNEKLGIKKQKEWRKNNPKQFYKLIAERQIELESNLSINTDFVFYDRSMIDLIGFCSYIEIDVPQIVTNHADTYNFDHVFICDTLPSFSDRSETGRSLSKEDSDRLAKEVIQAYKDLGFEITRLAGVSLAERIDKIERVLF